MITVPVGMEHVTAWSFFGPSASRQVEGQCFVGGVFVHVPACDYAGADHLIAEAGEAVGGVGVEGELEQLVGFAASTFPPVDVADGRKDRC